MTQEEKLRIYTLLRRSYPPGEAITPSAADSLLRENGITPQALGFPHNKAMFEAMPDYIRLQPRTEPPLLYDLILLDVAGQAPASPRSAPALTDADRRDMLRILRERYADAEQVTMAEACALLGQQGYTAARLGFSKALHMMRALEPDVTIVSRQHDAGNPQSVVYYVNLAPDPAPAEASAPSKPEPPETMTEDTIPFAPYKRRSLGGYLGKVEPAGEDLEALARAYAQARAKGEIFYSPDDEYWYFDTGLKTFETGKTILLAIEQTQEGWQVSHPSTRKLSDIEGLIRLGNSAPAASAGPEPVPAGAPETEPPAGEAESPAPDTEPTPAEVSPAAGPEPAAPDTEHTPAGPAPEVPPEHPEPPRQWLGSVFFHTKTQAILAKFLGGDTLSQEQLRRVGQDYDAALAADRVTWDERRNCFVVPLSLLTTEGYATFLSLKANDFPGGPAWRVNFVGHSNERPAVSPAPAPAGTEQQESAPTVQEQSTEEASAAEIAPAFSKLSDRDKLEIYNTLLPLNPVGSTILLSAASSTLSSHGITPRRYGYARFLQLVSDMPEYFRITSAQPRPGAPLVYSITMLPLPQAGSETLFPVVDPAVSDKPPFSMTERTIALPLSQQRYLAAFVNGGDDAKLSTEQLIEFQNSYESAVASGSLVWDEEHSCYKFPLTLTAKDGCALSATIRRSDSPTPPAWYVSFILKSSSRGVRPGGKLRQFAYLGDQTEFLRSLASHAEPEQWRFSDNPDDFSILWNYITYTFYRLDFEGKVYIDPSGDFAAFNTGLLSRRFGEDLLAYFEPNNALGKSQQWKFVCFCSSTAEAQTTAEKAAIRKLLLLDLELPRYFAKFYDTMFDPDTKLDSNFMHIIRDNLGRFPMDWLHKHCDDYPRTQAILAEIEAEIAQSNTLKKLSDGRGGNPELFASYRRQKELFKQLGEAVVDEEDDDMVDLLMALKDLFDGAVGRTVDRCRRNFKLAVPCYFPTRNIMSMLLPISLSHSKKSAPCLALVAERQEDTGIYLGRTVLTMAMAYNDARLLCRPCSEWLDTSHIHDDELDESLDD